MKIYVDAMGGDNAPQAIVEGAVEAVQAYNVGLTLVGDKEAILNSLKQYDYPIERIEILHADSVIGFDEEPVKAVRSKKDSSLVVALSAMRGKENAVLVSAGSTGAILAGGLVYLGRIKGIKRPALAVGLPKKGKVALLIDSGANADDHPEHLEQFGILGTAYCQGVMGYANPKVGLINIGSEAEKGSLLAKEAYQLLEENPAVNFIGNVEARDIPTTEADILVCDGFTGNVVLKLTEGLVSFVMHGIKDAVMGSVKGKIGGALIKNDLKAFKAQFDASEVGGAPFLGVKGGIIKAHGNSDAKAIKNAIKQAIDYTNGNVTGRIEKALALVKEEVE